MGTFLSDILSQPAVLDEMLVHFTKDQREVMDQVAGKINEYPRILLTSMGSALHSLMPMHYALSHTHPCVHLVEAGDALDSPFYPNTLYVIMSRSGESREIAQYSTILKERGEFLVSITMTPDSTLAKNATILIHDPAPFDGFICTKAYSSMVLIGLLLVSIARGRLNQQLISNLSKSFQWMEENKYRLVEVIESIHWLGNSLTFLSHGVGMGLSMAGSLWMEEGARIRANYSSIDEFRHGPIEQVDDQFHGVWIDLEQNDEDALFVLDMENKGGKFAIVRIDGDPATSIVVPSFGLPIEYRIIPTSMAIQLIANQSATIRGHVAGDMRYVNWVVQ